ncbi:MAG TPA: thiamine phosphate synthase [Candidatus Limnocylindria bacterium]|nr:thiamine phosphate synthase [Candidatus Limnocylindria bacterium]
MDSDALRKALRLYLVADAGIVPVAELAPRVAAALRGGVTMVQLRAKERTTREQLDLARALRSLCRTSHVPFVVNDRVDVALASGADGAHVGHIGREDMPPDDARALLGGDAIVGVSVGSADEASEAERLGASYVSAGPMYDTRTKSDAGAAVGPTLLEHARAATRLPLVGIGGITPDRVGALRAAGADGVCVARGILCAPDPAAAAREYIARWR